MSEEHWECVVSGAAPEEVWSAVVAMGAERQIFRMFADYSGRLVVLASGTLDVELRATELSSRLGCTLFENISFSRGIDYSCSRLIHRGEWLFEEGEAPDGYSYIRVAKGAPELRADSAHALSHVKDFVRRSLIARLGQPAMALFEYDPNELYDWPGFPERGSEGSF